MFKKGKAHQQKSLFDPYHSYSETMKKRLENSWAGFFFETVFLAIREERFAPLYSEKYSRPNVPVQTMVSLLILKEWNQLTDEELIDAFYFDYRFHHALGIEDIESERICINTLTHFRKRLLTYEAETGEDLLGKEIAFLSDRLAESISLDRSFGRMDSMLIASNCKAMSRIELIYTVNRNMVQTMASLDGIDVPETFKAYLEPSHQKKTLYRLHTDETQTRTDFLLGQSLDLYHHTASLDLLRDTEAFVHLSRLIEEQMIETEEGARIPLAGNQLPSGRLNNPSDPDATFRRKGNTTSIGYTLNFLEVRDREKGIGLLLDQDVQKNTYSDTAFGEDFVTSHPLMDPLHTLVCDGAYYRAETVQQAKEKQVDFHVTQMTGGKEKEDRIAVDQFAVDTHHIITTCPGGKAPLHAEYREEKGVYLAKWIKSDCQGCPLRMNCPVVEGKELMRLRFTEKQRIAAQTRAKIQSPEYRDLACFRAGVEGIPSVLRRRWGIDCLPIRGLLRSKMWIGLKCMAHNLRQTLQYRLRGASSPFFILYILSIQNSKGDQPR